MIANNFSINYKFQGKPIFETTNYAENQRKREQHILKLSAIAVFLLPPIVQFLSMNGIFVNVFGLSNETSDTLIGLMVCIVQSINPFIYLVILHYVYY